MTGKPEILFLAHRIPYPPDKGDKIRSWRLLRHLTERFDVHLACFVDDGRDLKHMDFLGGLCASSTFVRLRPRVARLKSLPALLSDKALTFAYYRNEKMAAAVNKLRERPLAAEIVFSSSMAPYIAPPIAGRKRIVDFCDADSEKWRQYALETRGPLGWIYAREGDALARAETEIANWADASFAVTAEEAALFNRRERSDRHVDWWSNGVDIKYFDPACIAAPPGTTCDVVFVGAMNYRANVDAVLEFTREVWPKIRAAAPNAHFAIVGANPTAEIKGLDGADGVAVTGYVEDVRPWLASAKLVVAPLRVARGIQNKVLEAMAMARPVIGTSEAMTGIDCDADAVGVANNATEMATAIISLLNDPGRRDAMGAAARVDVIANYDWDARLTRFDRALATI